jgi:hypothetical protein
MIEASTTLKGNLMILKPEFANMVDRMGLEDGELALAEIVWQRCEKAMQQKPQQEAVLVSDKLQKFLQTYAYNHRSVALTTDELHWLTTMFTTFLRLGEDNLAAIKEEIQGAWLLCDPDDPKTEDNFAYLNELRTIQQKWKKSHKRLSSIQTKLKKNRKM